MKKLIVLLLIVALFTPSLMAADNITTGTITGSTVLSGLCSLILWPGLGQAMNNANGEKVLWHAVLGIVEVAVIKVPVIRIWSGYDGLVDRRGGYFGGKI